MMTHVEIQHPSAPFSTPQHPSARGRRCGEKRQLDVVQTSLAKKNGKLVTQLVNEGRATLHVCSYRRRRTGCFYFGLGFNG